MSESQVVTSILGAAGMVRGVQVFDPPKQHRNIRDRRLRDLYRRQLDEVIRRAESVSFGAVLWRHNVGAARLPSGKAPGGREKLVPVFFGLPGQPDIVGILRPSGRFFGREVKQPGRSVLKDGSEGAHKHQPRPEQRAWGDLIRASGGDWGVWRSAAEAVEDLRRLIEEEASLADGLALLGSKAGR